MESNPEFNVNNLQCRVLVVDDEPSINDILENVLEAAGATVWTANSAEEALCLHETHEIEVVITDIHMDGMSGFDLLGELFIRDPNSKVIMMTGYDTYDSVRRALQEGAYDYLTKPLEDHDLIVAAVHRAYENVKLIQENNKLISRLQASHTKVIAANQRLVHLNKRLRHLAITDELTQIYNRRFIDRTMQTETEQRTRLIDPLSVLLLDVDHFKLFNDSHGHDGGDKALQHVAQILTNNSRSGDLIGRYGGEEFICILPGTSAKDANIIAENIRNEIKQQPLIIENRKAPITVSIGISSSLETRGNVSGRSLIVQADNALYAAKYAGRDRTCHYDSFAENQDESESVETLPKVANG